MLSGKGILWGFGRSTQSHSVSSTFTTLYLISDLGVTSLNNKAEEIFTARYLKMISNLMSEKLNTSLYKNRIFLEGEFGKAQEALGHTNCETVIYKLKVPSGILNPKFLQEKKYPVILPKDEFKKNESSDIVIEEVFFAPNADFIDLGTWATRDDKKLAYKRF